MATILFWFSAGAVAYVYFGYPMIVRSPAAIVARLAMLRYATGKRMVTWNPLR